MARAPKQVKNANPSTRSRAARRAASPSAKIDRSLEDENLTSEHRLQQNGQSDALAPQHGSGVSKKKKQKPLKRQKRVRQEKANERASIVADQLEKKVNRSKGKLKVVKDRSTGWDDVNGTVAPQKRAKTKRNTRDKDSEAVDDDEQMKDIVDDTVIDSKDDDNATIEPRDVNNDLPGKEFLDAASNADSLNQIT
ncbi:MAG: hypothetical protein M1831_004335 [Alyxoria varia]|nr:MAG: hypothetical protein M1831_004335 [Alyxoria varia]